LFGGLFTFLMKKQLLLGVFLLLLILPVCGQNLVRNPGMDSTFYCPNGLGDMTPCQNWFNPTSNSPDYFHLCQPGLAPNNAAGWQMPQSDSGYLGFAAFFPSNSREYVTGNLSSPLDSGIHYCFSFYASLADGSTAGMTNLGIYFSQDDPTMLTDTNTNPFLFVLPYTPTYEDPRLLVDTANWVLITDTFTAQGGEVFLTIGNFRLNSNVTWDTLDPAAPFTVPAAYYYVDEVSVTLCQDTTTPPPPPPPIEPVSSLSAPNGFSPNSDGINDLFTVQYKDIASYQCSIFNRWGNLIWQSTDVGAGWNGTYQGAEVPEGTYFYLIEATGVDEKVYLLKGFLMLVR
jgi:gliding motility-associated-like protein